MAAMMSPPISAMWFLDLFIDHERSSRKYRSTGYCEDWATLNL